jgi:hypothetical protein
MGQTTFSGPVKSDGGFIENSFSTAERDALTPVTGLLIYNTDTNIYEVYGNSGWQEAFAPPGPAPLPGVAYSVANGDWPAGVNGFSGGVSWGGGFNLELDYSASISPAALATFNALTTGSTIVITTADGQTHYVVVTSATFNTNGTTNWVFLDTGNPSGYGPGSPDLVIAINVY